MKRVVFLINRLRRMSLPEIGYRIKQKGQGLIEKRRFEKYRFDTTVTRSDPTFFSRDIELADAGEIIRKADLICDNRMDLFALKACYLGETIHYHTDYKSRKKAPEDKFGKTVDYRDSERIGDVKYIWEINRHLFLVPLALAYKVTKDKKYLSKFEEFLSRWFEQNPFMRGVNWCSSLELGIRLINWTFCWHLLGPDVRDELRIQWLDSIYKHCWFVSRNFSAFSSANNHRIGEAAGLFVASVALPSFKISAKWRKKAYKILIQECEKQNYRDGVNKEQAISYQQFVLDFLLVAYLAGKANKVDFPQNYCFTVEKMLVYLAAIEDIGGNVPKVGDEDDGFAVDLAQREYGVYRSLLNTGAYIFNRGDFLKEDRGLDNKSVLLLNIGNFNTHRRPERKGGIPARFDEGGYYLLGKDFNSPYEQELLFDCGPLGYLSLAAHGHADALSFYFSAGGLPIFVDPGTYAYHGDKKWRNYFRSTAAHNTARIDRKDQSVMTGNFMWGRRAKSELFAYVDKTEVRGMHDGYTRLRDGVTHLREIRMDGETGVWHIADEFICGKSHEVELFLHLYPDWQFRSEGHEGIVDFGKGTCSLSFDPALEISVHRGDEKTPLGWYSSAYDVKCPAVTIRLYGRIKGTTRFNNQFKIKFI